MNGTEITERQQYWLDHIQAAEAFDGSIADNARAEGLTPRELYQWKTILTRRGLLTGKKASTDFVQVMGYGGTEWKLRPAAFRGILSSTEILSPRKP